MEFAGMKRWENRVALVTGGSAGIGSCITENLVKYGMIVVSCSRNIDSLKKQQAEFLKQDFKGKLHPYQCDLRQETEIDDMFSWIKANLGGVDVCINNAGFTTSTSLLEIKPSEMRDMLDTNVIALVQCSQLAIKSMLERNVNDGHVLNINSVLGHTVSGVFNFYASTKFAVTALTQGFRKELVEKNLRIKVTSISPGRTETRFLHTAYDSEKAEKIYAGLENLTPEDVTNCLLHALAAPPHVQIQIIIEPIQQTPQGYYNK